MRLFELIKSIVHPTDAASGKRKRSFPTNERLVKKKKYSCTLCGKEGKDKRHPDCPFRNFKTPPGRFNQLISVWNEIFSTIVNFSEKSFKIEKIIKRFLWPGKNDLEDDSSYYYQVTWVRKAHKAEKVPFHWVQNNYPNPLPDFKLPQLNWVLILWCIHLTNNIFSQQH